MSLACRLPGGCKKFVEDCDQMKGTCVVVFTRSQSCVPGALSARPLSTVCTQIAKTVLVDDIEVMASVSI